MKYLSLTVAASFLLFLTPPGTAQEEEFDPERRMHEMELEEREIELEARRAERELDLERQQLELDRMRGEMDRPPRDRCGKHPCGKRPCGHHKGAPPGGCLLLLGICIAVHILLAVWVFGDIRKRKTGSGIWIAIVLLTGLLGVIPYAIVRLGDREEEE